MFHVFFFSLSLSLSLLQDSCIACCYFRNLCVFVLRYSPHIATSLTIDVEAKIANEIWLNVSDQSPAAVARGDLVQVPWNTRQRFKVCDPSPCVHHIICVHVQTGDVSLCSWPRCVNGWNRRRVQYYKRTQAEEGECRGPSHIESLHLISGIRARS